MYENKMASIIKKKTNRKAPLVRLCASERAKQFSGDLYEDGNILFCKFCEHSIDFKRVDTVIDHLGSKKHVKNKSAKIAKSDGDDQPPAKRQVTLFSAFQSKDLREEFILDFVRLCTMADIPLEKAEKMLPFMRKHCKQGGALPQAATLRSLYVPRQFQVHLSALKQAVQGCKVSIITDETTDVRDHSILNVVAGVRGKYFLIDVCTMEACNHSTLSASVIKAVTSVGIEFQDIIAFVTDSAAYCKKAAREVLQPIFSNSCHVRCLAHIINLSAEVFQLWPEFSRVEHFVKMMKSVFFKKPARKTSYLKFLKEYLPKDQVKLPPPRYQFQLVGTLGLKL